MLVTIVLIQALGQIAAGADRLAEFETLTNAYTTAEQQYFETPEPAVWTLETQIAFYESQPIWTYLPKFFALAQARPDDEAAFRSCAWIIDYTNGEGNFDRRLFQADEQAWAILADHHWARPDLPELCGWATRRLGPARDRFLRRILAREGVPREHRAYANTALAVLLAAQHDQITFRNAPKQGAFTTYLRERWAPERTADLTADNAERFKTESMQRFRAVRDQHYDIPIAITAPAFKRYKTLGEKADAALNALMHLTVGAEPPNIVGEDLFGTSRNLHDYRGQVVIVSFWFTGCVPCMALVPHEIQLLEAFRGKPFALLGVCSDTSPERAQQTAEARGMAWPHWLDGQNGPIARAWNLEKWPTMYLLDRQGRIVAKDLDPEAWNAAVARLLEVAD